MSVTCGKHIPFAFVIILSYNVTHIIQQYLEEPRQKSLFYRLNKGLHGIWLL